MKSLKDHNAKSKGRKLSKEMETNSPNDSAEVSRLKNQIAELREQMIALQADNEKLRQQKTIVVERERSSSDSVKEQQHNFFKYSNARRY